MSAESGPSNAVPGSVVPPGERDRRFRFILGVAFIAASFLVYPAYLVIPFLPLSGTMKFGIALLALLLSWGMFGIGFYLSGREGYEWLKRRLTL
jgi:hypothetical protein